MLLRKSLHLKRTFNSYLQSAKIMVCFVERGYCRWKFYIAGIGIFHLFGSCDLELDQMTFIYKLDPYSLEIYRVCEYELNSNIKTFESYRLTERHTDRQTGRQTGRQADRHDQNYIPRRFASRVVNRRSVYLLFKFGIVWSIYLWELLSHGPPD